jgi:hypothetical protein
MEPAKRAHPRQSKRLKLQHIKSAMEQLPEEVMVPVQMEEKPIDGFDICDIWLPDGPCFVVYSFLCNGSINVPRNADGISSLVHNYSLISSDFHKSIQRYLQSAPMTIRCGRFAHNLTQRIEMICEKQVNLSEFHYDLVKEDDDSTSTTNAHGDAHDHDASSESKLEDYIKILSSCKISNLHTLGFYTFHTFDSKKSIDFQKYIAQELATILCKPTKIIMFIFNELHVPMLTKFSSSLEELEISITRYNNQVGVIEALPRLRKLKLCFSMTNSPFYVSIRSASLHELIIANSPINCKIQECVCPCLKSLQSDFFPPSSTYQLLLTNSALVQLRKTDLDGGSIHPNSFHGKRLGLSRRTVSHRNKSIKSIKCPCVGIKVPDDCMLVFKYRDRSIGRSIYATFE